MGYILDGLKRRATSTELMTTMKLTRQGILWLLLLVGLALPGATGSALVLRPYKPAQTHVASRVWSVSLQTGEHSVSPNPASGSASLATHASDVGLPNPSSALPLLSIIGFGVLMGGIFSARRTR